MYWQKQRKPGLKQSKSVSNKRNHMTYISGINYTLKRESVDHYASPPPHSADVPFFFRTITFLLIHLGWAYLYPQRASLTRQHLVTGDALSDHLFSCFLPELLRNISSSQLDRVLFRPPQCFLSYKKLGFADYLCSDHSPPSGKVLQVTETSLSFSSSLWDALSSFGASSLRHHDKSLFLSPRCLQEFIAFPVVLSHWSHSCKSILKPRNFNYLIQMSPNRS